MALRTRRWTGDPVADARINRSIRYIQMWYVEAGLAVMMVAYGLVLVAPIPTFEGPEYAWLAAHVPEHLLGLVAVGVGTARLVALWVNGRRRETPVIRMIGCSLGFLFWLIHAVGFWAAVPPLAEGCAIFPILCLAELTSSYYAGMYVVASGSLFRGEAGDVGT